MKDILLKNDELVISDGDFVVGESDLQNVLLIVSIPPGSWKQFPLTGVGEAKFINAPLDGALRREIQLQLQADGYRLNSVNILPSGNLDIQFQ